MRAGDTVRVRQGRSKRAPIGYPHMRVGEGILPSQTRKLNVGDLGLVRRVHKKGPYSLVSFNDYPDGPDGGWWVHNWHLLVEYRTAD